MPKGKIEEMKGKTRLRIAAMRKFKIGGRKSVRSARQMSNDDLRKVIQNGSNRDQQKARNELTRRGAALVLPVEAVEAEAA